MQQFQLELERFIYRYNLPEHLPVILLGLVGLLLVCIVILLVLNIISRIRNLRGRDEKKALKAEKRAAKKAKKKSKNASDNDIVPLKAEKNESVVQPSFNANKAFDTSNYFAAKEPESENNLSAETENNMSGEDKASAETNTTMEEDLREKTAEERSSANQSKDTVPDEFVSKEKNTEYRLAETDMELAHVADELAALRNLDTEDDKGKKNKKKKTSFSEKKAAKRANKNLKKKSTRLKVPKTVQQTIPYTAVYPDDGFIETSPGTFTRSYLIGDVNYQIAKDDEQVEMFMKFGQLMNSFESSMNFQITVNQKNINMDEFEEHTLLSLKGDNLDELRTERNNMLRKKIMEGKNHLVKEKYLTVAIKADSYEAAQAAFVRMDAEIDANVKKIGQASATPISSSKRLEILHDIYNIGEEGSFGNNMICHELEDGSTEYIFADEKFRFDIMRRMGLTTKDMIGPSSFKFLGDYGMMGDTYFRALFLRKIPTFLSDNVLSELTNTECNMITSLHYKAIDGEKAQKLVRNQITNINANMVDKQKKASRAGYSTELISPELRDAANETSELLDDINSKNQKLFYVTVVIVHFADSKQKLDSDTKAIQAIGRRLLCDVKKLSQQQENGLNTALPLANNQLAIKRTLTTESAAVFMPFQNQELNDISGMYYGNNAVSHNIIQFDRRMRKNGNGFIFGTPGSGKSMTAKQEMLTVLLSSDDTVVVIDPEGEYYPMAEMLGGEVIRIAAGADIHINPFDIDLSEDMDEKDDPMAIKADFIVSLCETIVGERYGLAPQQRSIIDRCVKKAYEPYLSSRDPITGKYDQSRLPTLVDFYNLLRQQPGIEAMQLADGLEIYITGSLNIFAHQTNVEYSKRFVVFDIKDVGSTMKSMALLVVLDNIWNRMVAGRKQCRYTWTFIDEIYLLFKNESSAEFLKNLYKRARKYYGLPTGITQNVSDLLENDTARTMISNCESIIMLNQAPLDRAQLAELLNLSPTQLGFVTNSNPGEGLIYDGSVVVPFINKLPKETKQYMAMTTKPNEVRERDALKKQAESENSKKAEEDIKGA